MWRVSKREEFWWFNYGNFESLCYNFYHIQATFCENECSKHFAFASSFELISILIHFSRRSGEKKESFPTDGRTDRHQKMKRSEISSPLHSLPPSLLRSFDRRICSATVQVFELIRGEGDGRKTHLNDGGGRKAERSWRDWDHFEVKLFLGLQSYNSHPSIYLSGRVGNAMAGGQT